MRNGCVSPSPFQFRRAGVRQRPEFAANVARGFLDPRATPASFRAREQGALIRAGPLSAWIVRWLTKNRPRTPFPTCKGV